MDKWLLSGASLLLILECLVFIGDPILGDLGWFGTASHLETSAEHIGVVSYSFHNVKQKNHDSLVWQDSPANSPLYAYDSVLTLKDSSAKLKLQGDIQLEVRQNTLVVLEPPQSASAKNLLLRFSKGNVRSRSSTQSFRMGHGEWTFEAQPGTDVSLRSIAEGEVEIEVAKGEVQLQHPELKAKAVKSGQRIQIQDDTTSEVENLNTSLKWNSGDHIKVYAHEFPAAVDLSWQGTAQQLTIENDQHEVFSYSLDTQRFLHDFNLGNYWLTLRNSEGSSTKLSLQVLQAPHFIYLSPLPRDRYKLERPVEFYWMRSPSIEKYRLEISRSEQFNKIETSELSSLPGVTKRFAEEGDYYWRIIGLDPDGFEVPSPYVYPIYPVEKPLSAPQLMLPNQPRLPATKDKSTSFWLWDLLFPQAHADELKRKIVFNWYPVPEADFYLIEISSTPDFLKPEVIVKTKETRYAWSDFELKTYYFRVAGGQDTGRKGLFSEPMKVDLSQLENKATGEIQPGVEYAIEDNSKLKSSKKPVETKEQPSAPEPKEQAKTPPVDSPKASPTPAPPTVEAKGTKQDQSFEFSLYLGGSYLYSKSQGPDFSSHIQNFSQSFASAHLNVPLKKKGSVQLKASYSPLTWKPKNSGPFQDEQSEDFLKAALLYRFFESRWAFGVGYQSWGYLLRQGPEKLSLEQRQIVSAHIATKRKISDNWQSLHEINLAFWNDDQLIQVNNQFDYLWASHKLSIGPRLDVGYLKTKPDFTRFQYELGFTFGIHF